ncbi:MAG TPA: ISL3 family transposase [Thermoanaerobaculia bacterium]
MDYLQLFEAALGLTPPWKIEKVTFDPKAEGGGAVEIRLTFPRGAKFPCPGCQAPSSVHDTHEQRWRHLNFFQYRAYIVAPIPRTDCPEHGVKTFSGVSWAREGSGFTLLFEALVMLVAREMPVAALARMTGEHDTRLWRLIQAHVEDARERVDMKDVRELVVDETSRARGHDYVSLFVEPGKEEARVLFVADGRTHDTFKTFCSDLRAHGGEPGKIRDVCMDMSEAFQKGAAENLPGAKVTFDRFHVMKLVGEAVDEVRRLERAEQPALKGTRYTWLKNPGDLTGSQFAGLIRLSELNLKTTKAYQMRLNVQEAWTRRDAATARRLLKEWCGWVARAARPAKGTVRSGLEPMARVARTIREHLRGILNYFRRRLTSGVIEGINSMAQAARARARGYRSAETFKAMIYLIAGRLQFNLPSLTS